LKKTWRGIVRAKLPAPVMLAPLKRRRAAPVEVQDMSHGSGPFAELAALKR